MGDLLNGSVDEKSNFLKTVNIFSSLSEGEIHTLLPFLHLMEIDGDKTIFHEGEDGHELFIVRSGRVAISIKLSDGRKRELAEFLPGDFFGEMSIFDSAPRSATCYTKERSSLFFLRAGDFFSLIKHHPSIALKVMHRMARITLERLHNTNAFISDMVHWGEEARRRAITDEFTGAYNRHFLEEAMENNFEVARNMGESLSFIMVDLDNFRSINELYGHSTGDRVIMEVVSVFKKYLRSNDILARYGGDEFAILMPRTDLEQARNIAENICKEVASIPFLKNLGGEITRITISQGIAAFPDHANDIETLRKKADDALYRAKEMGRNRVECAEKS
jgi:diguanylate cyclase (GGDEF)-like protein